MFGYLIYLDPVTPHDFDSAPLESGQRGFSLLLLLTVFEKSSPRMKKILGSVFASPYSVRTWHQFHIQVCKKHDIVKVNREKGVPVAQNSCLWPRPKA